MDLRASGRQGMPTDMTDMTDTRIYWRLGLFKFDGYDGYADTRIFWGPGKFDGYDGYSDMTDIRI